MEVPTGLLPSAPVPPIQPHLNPLAQKSSGARANGDTTDIQPKPGMAEFASLKKGLGLKKLSYPMGSLVWAPNSQGEGAIEQPQEGLVGRETEETRTLPRHNQ